MFDISRKYFMRYLQDGEEPSTEYTNILERCIYRDGFEEVEDHLKVNINGTRTAWVCKNSVGINFYTPIHFVLFYC